MASRRAQIRHLFQSLPSTELSGTSFEALYTRCEANLAAVDAWATQGNQQAVRKAGTGLVALCAWLAAKTLAENARVDVFQQASGLSPKQFTHSERELLPAIQRIASTTAGLSTPRKTGATAAGSTSTLTPGGGAAEAVAKWAEDIKNGISPGKRSSGPNTPTSARTIQPHAAVLSAASTPGTPSRSGLRDRSTIKSKPTFDPSPVRTPTKPKRSATGQASTPRPATTPQKRTASQAASQDSPIRPDTVPSTTIDRRLWAFQRDPSRPSRYPVTLGFSLDDPDLDGKPWDADKARKRIRRCLQALQAGQPSDTWQTGTTGSVESVAL